MADELLFDWDEVNREHVARHGITPEECEEVILGEPADVGERVVADEVRVVLVGPTEAGRFLIVSFVEQFDGRIRVVTAYPASRRTVRDYIRLRGH